MSHYSVMVCLPSETADIEKALSEVLAPFDENTSVDPRRDYEEGGPEDYWFVVAIRRNAKHHREGSGLKPYEPNGFFSYSSDASRKTHDEQRAEFAEWAALEPKLDDPVTWPTVASLHNERYGHTERGEDGDLNREMLHVDEDGRAYTWTTYNPLSKWDYWRVGGRWGGYFIVKDEPYFELGEAGDPKRILVVGEPGWDSPSKSRHPGRNVCDGGPRRLLDFEAMRERAGIEADDRYSRYEKLTEQHGTAKPWSHFRELAEAKCCTWDEARAAYREQPLIMAHHQLPHEQQLTGLGCIVVEFSPPRVEYVIAARAAAVPAYATLTLAGEWAAPGRMGWWGVSSDDEADRTQYHAAINEYLDGLAPDTLLVVVDCHI